MSMQHTRADTGPRTFCKLHCNKAIFTVKYRQLLQLLKYKKSIEWQRRPRRNTLKITVNLLKIKLIGYK